MRPPKDLGPAGRKVWRDVFGALELEGGRRAVAEEACRVADTMAQLSEAVEVQGMMSVGSRGQPVLHPAVGELGKQRALFERLLRSIDVTDGSVSAASVQAAKAATSRRLRERDAAARREGIGRLRAVDGEG